MITRLDESRLDTEAGTEPKSITYRNATKLVAGVAVAIGVAFVLAGLVVGLRIGLSGGPDAWVGAPVAATGVGTSIMFFGLGFALLWAVTVDEERDQ